MKLNLLILSLCLFMFGPSMAQTTDQTKPAQDTVDTTDTKKTADNKKQEIQDDSFTLDTQADEYFGQPLDDTQKPTVDKK